TVHDLRETGDVADVLHVEPCLTKRSCGAAGGHQLPPHLGQAPGEGDETGLVGYGKKCAWHLELSRFRSWSAGPMRSAGTDRGVAEKRVHGRRCRRVVRREVKRSSRVSIRSGD